ncbi:MAG TPA: hypothetical protein VKT70_15010 [Stellaceae bacterium]|nr:hypothetical protein [Stellaceae bacterium]
MYRSKSEAPNQVRALFKQASLSFDLPKETTLEELATELALLGRRFGGLPIYVDVKVRS